MHFKNIIKIEKYKNHLKYKISKNKHTTDKDKNNQIHTHIKIHLNNINKIDKYKNLNMTEHKTDLNITKCKKLNMAEHKTDMDNTKYKNRS